MFPQTNCWCLLTGVYLQVDSVSVQLLHPIRRSIKRVIIDLLNLSISDRMPQ